MSLNNRLPLPRAPSVSPLRFRRQSLEVGASCFWVRGSGFSGFSSGNRGFGVFVGFSGIGFEDVRHLGFLELGFRVQRVAVLSSKMPKSNLQRDLMHFFSAVGGFSKF